jgi:capsular polysaccharide biosynthesis protein
MLELLQIYSVNLEKVVWLSPLSQYSVEELLVPTILSHSKNGVMPTQIVRSLFGDIKQKNIVNKHSHEIVFVKYQPLTSVNSRHWENQEEVMETLINMGVSILDPLKESVTQTIEKFCRAKLIISQDGSGLHNCIFSNADCVVIETLPRANLLHISIQDVISRKIAYLPCNLEDDGQYYLSHENLDSLVDIVNAAKSSR